ncbi:protein kinase [Myxococcota bacterium]|nr:protein kinase [Myxococcota bacterium]
MLEPLARGGMGQVYLAVYGEPGLEKFCAIKKILSSSQTAEALLRFQSEVEITLRMSHGNLVSVFDVGVLGQEAYMAMELVEGENLRMIWNQCAQARVPFPLPVIVYAMKEAARGLAYAHNFNGMDLVHRDVSPPNLMFTFSGEIKVLDFGLALSGQNRRFTKPGIIYGKMPYLAPEQAAGEEMTGSTDVYSLGILFWELVTGHRLFEPGKEEDMMRDLKTRAQGPAIRPPSEVCGRGDSKLDALILGMLDPDPAERPSASDVVALANTWLGQNAPGTDSRDAAGFMHALFVTERKQQVSHRDRLLEDYKEYRSRKRDIQIRAGDLIAQRYQITRILGEGGMGRVYEAIHQPLGRRVAVKVLEPKGKMSPEEAGVRFEREAKAASRISHPSVVEVLDYGFIEGVKPFLVMELLEGHNLGEILTQGPLAPHRACKYASQIAYGIAAAHEAGLIHRDIKPDNLHLVRDPGGDERIKLIDFGIAKSFSGVDEDLTRPGITLGTPEYIAPELLLGEKATCAADIYSFGAVVYEFFAGVPPYQSENTQTIIQNKIKGLRRRLSDVRPDLPGGLVDLIENCMQQDPHRRPTSLRETAQRMEYWARMLAPEPMQERRRLAPGPAPARAVPRKPASAEGYNWMPAVLTLAGVVVFIGGLVAASGPQVEFSRFAPVPVRQRLQVPVAEQPQPVRSVEIVAVAEPVPVKSVRTRERRSAPRRAMNAAPRSAAAGGWIVAAEKALDAGQIPRAYELARRASAAGGGEKARELEARARALLGL